MKLVPMGNILRSASVRRIFSPYPTIMLTSAFLSMRLVIDLLIESTTSLLVGFRTKSLTWQSTKSYTLRLAL